MTSIDSIIFKHFQKFEEAFKLRLGLRFDDAIREYDIILSEAEENLKGVNEYALGQIKSMAHSYKGDSHRIAARPAKAIPEFSDALNIAKDPFVRAIALEFKGIYETQFGDKKQAVNDHEESLKLYTEVGHLEKMARMHSVLGASYIGTQDYDKAEMHFKKVLELTNDIILGVMDGKEEYKIYSKEKAMANRADAFHRNGENMTLWGEYILTRKMDDHAMIMFHEALESLEEAVKLFTELDDRGRAALVHGRMAYTFALLGDEKGCSDAYTKYMEGVNGKLVQPAAVKVMKPYIDLVEGYLIERGHEKLSTF